MTSPPAGTKQPGMVSAGCCALCVLLRSSSMLFTGTGMLHPGPGLHAAAGGYTSLCTKLHKYFRAT
jgi:hypothetical protein